MIFKKISMKQGFTMVEILMVAIIIGLLAAVVYPGIAAQRSQVAISATKANLETLRTAIDLYEEEEGMLPDPFLNDLADGTSPSGTMYLEYIPKERITGSAQVVITLDGTGGWVWMPGIAVHVNLYGNDVNGDAYWDY